MPAPRPRATPWLDALSLLLLAAGAVVLALAWRDFARLEGGWSPSDEPMAAGARYDATLRLALAGAATVIAGLAVGVAATVRTRRIRRAALLAAGATR